jgi:ubiquinone/menaquinone biosynthesis C-methylase UbiE
MVEQPPEGPSWGRLADRSGLAAVLDPADTVGIKNRLIDRVHKRALGRALGKTSGLRVLDFGCGNGRLSVWLAGRGARVTGIDATPEMIESARRSAPHVSFQHFDGSAIPLADASIDAVISAYVLQYYVADTGTYVGFLREFRRVLAPSGRVAMVEQVTNGSIGRGGVLEQYIDGLREAPFTIDHIRPVRAGGSRIVELAQSWPRLERLALFEMLLPLEARLLAGSRLRGDAYIDYLFLARP